MSYTNSGLVSHCKKALELNTRYMWGGLFREITADYVSRLAAQYPSQYSITRKAALNGLTGTGYYGCDCVGLVKSYYFGGFGTAANAKGYDANKDYSVGSMYSAAKIKGKIADMPQKAGILVMTENLGHVGVYVGDGKVIECTLRGSLDGVVQTDFSAVAWAYWCQCPCIEDDSAASSSSTTSANPTAAADGDMLPLNSIVEFAGGQQYVSSTATEGVKANAGRVKITTRAPGAAHPYHAVSVDNSGVYGWVDADKLNGAETIDATYEAGTKLALSNVGLYASSTAKTATCFVTGDYYLYDGEEIDGMLRICPKSANVGKLPIAVNVTGWVKAADIK